MKAEELRLGNFVNIQGDPPTMYGQVSSIHIGSVRVLYAGDKDTVPYGIDIIRAIPLTEEWLIKFGFHQSKGKFGPTFHILEESGFVVMFTVEHWTDTDADSKWKNHWHTTGLLKGNKLQYVHQLQNLYFALTGTDLITSPEIK